jgi:hypothetical protein
MADDARVEALLRERAGYVRRGLPGRAAEVDAQLEAAGYTPPAEAPVDAPVEEAGGGSARGRSGRRG